MRNLLIILAAVFAMSTAAQASTLTITPADFAPMFGDVRVGDTVTFSLDVDLTDPSQGGRFNVVYDENVFQLDGSFALTADNPWNDGGGLDVANISESPGVIDIGLSAGFDSITGGFNIGSFSLIAQAESTSTMVGLDDSQVAPTSRWGLNGTPIAIDFSGSVGSVAPIPIPAVAYMFPAGLIAGLGWMRRRGRSIAS